MIPVSTFAERLRTLLDEKKLSQADLSRKCGLSRATLSRYLQGQFEAKQDSIYRIARATGVSEAWLMGAEVPMDYVPPAPPPAPETHASNLLPFPASNLQPMFGTKARPRLGDIACGEPALAEQHFEGMDIVPDFVDADFTLQCHGDSMINARIFDGDIVCIRQQETVENGEIAAVLVDGEEATLKRVHIYPDHIVLEPENPKYRPLPFWEEDMNRVRILGKATYFISTVK